MPKPRVYVETTIPSFYHDARLQASITERRRWTRMWWQNAFADYDLITSSVVVAEAAAGSNDQAPLRMELLRGLPVVSPDEQVAEIVQVYLRHKLMPAKSSEDAFHLALASYHRCDYIVTWNCRHLANANKTLHIRSINHRLGLHVPRLVTPRALLEEER